MEEAWESRALDMREAARAASRKLRAELLMPGSRADVPAGMRAGVATADITPEGPVYLDGYWSDRLSTRVNDRLQVKAMVIDDGYTRVALVVVDLIAYFYLWVERVRSLQTSVSPQNVVICTTHTHSCPCILGMFGPPGAVDQAYVDRVGETIAKTIDKAADQLVPVKIGFGTAKLPFDGVEIPSFARNWHNPGVMDTDVLLMRVVDDASDKAIANVVNLGNHPDVLGDQSTLVSADFFAYVYDDITRELGGETLVFQRALGGVEPIPQGVNEPDAMEPALRAVAGVATSAVLRAAGALEWCVRPRLTYRRVPTAFPVTSGEVLKAHALGLLPVDAADGVQHNEMCLIEIGAAQFLTVPGEPHPEVVSKLTSMMPAKYPFVVAMANDEIGYVVAQEIFNRAGIQELLSAGSDNERVVLSAARTLLGVDSLVTPVELQRLCGTHK
ncbi:MAG: DUF2070 family protein [Candidatus Hydrogenedentes bacterium]|nr:DUF2070 family protein [Candidatus Hydrogenedentota bacterium]